MNESISDCLIVVRLLSCFRSKANARGATVARMTTAHAFNTVTFIHRDRLSSLTGRRSAANQPTLAGELSRTWRYKRNSQDRRGKTSILTLSSRAPPTPAANRRSPTTSTTGCEILIFALPAAIIHLHCVLLHPSPIVVVCLQQRKAIPGITTSHPARHNDHEIYLPHSSCRRASKIADDSCFSNTLAPSRSHCLAR